MHPEHRHHEQEPNPDTSPHQAAAPLREASAAGPRADELTPAEHEEKDKAATEATAALGSIWETLRKHRGKRGAGPDLAELRAGTGSM